MRSGPRQDDRGSKALTEATDDHPPSIGSQPDLIAWTLPRSCGATLGRMRSIMASPPLGFTRHSEDEVP